MACSERAKNKSMISSSSMVTSPPLSPHPYTTLFGEKPKRGKRTTSARKKKADTSEAETTEIKQESEQTEEPKTKAKTVAKRPRRPRATKKASEEKEE